MPEHPEHKSGNNIVEATIGLAIVIITFMYIHDQLLLKHMQDVLIAVFAFGAGLIFLYRYFK